MCVGVCGVFVLLVEHERKRVLHVHPSGRMYNIKPRDSLKCFREMQPERMAANGDRGV